MLQWTIQEQKPRGQANPIKLFSVRIVVCNSTMKLESLVIVDQHATVNTFPGLVHRPSHHEFVTPEAGGGNHLELAVEGGTNDWEGS